MDIDVVIDKMDYVSYMDFCLLVQIAYMTML